MLLQFRNFCKKIKKGEYPWILFGLNRFFMGNSYRVNNNNDVSTDNALLIKSCIDVKGHRNEVIMMSNTLFRGGRIIIFGNNNRIVIENNCYLDNLEIWIEDDGNTVIIGDGTFVSGRTQLAAIEGTSITIGNDCMFASDIFVRTGDSHSILDMSGKRTNVSRDISIGEHVWVGQKVIILKGTCIAANSIIAAGALVSGEFEDPNTIIGGLPAKVIKKGIGWLRERI